MKCIWITDEDKVKGFKCEFSPVDMLIVVSGLKYITADIERHPKDRERAQGIYNQIMLCRYYDEADRKTENSSEKPNNCETCKHWEYDAKYRWWHCPLQDNGMYECHYEPKDEPQTSCKSCRYGEVDEGYVRCAYYSKSTEPKDEPQTCDDCIWNVCNYNKAFEDEPQTTSTPYKVDTSSICKIEPQTDCAWK